MFTLSELDIICEALGMALDRATTPEAKEGIEELLFRIEDMHSPVPISLPVTTTISLARS